MRVCGVELAGSDAIISLLYMENGQFNVPDCRVRKLTLKKEHTGEELQQFQLTFSKLMKDYSVRRVVIRERQTKGKFAGGAISFKLEAAIQLISDIDVEMFSPARIKSVLSDNPMSIPFSSTGLKAFQEGAFTIAYAAHMSM